MKKYISLILSVVLLFAIALSTPVVATVINIDDVGSYTCEAGSVFVFKAPESGAYAINSYGGLDPLMVIEYDDGTEIEYDSFMDDGELCAFVFLEADEGVRCKIGTDANDGNVNFTIQLVAEAIADAEYSVHSNSCYSFTPDHDDYYSICSFDGADPYVEVVLPDGNYKTFDDEKGLDFSGELYLKKGEKIFLSLKDYDGADFGFKISCDCSGYGDIKIESGNSYTIPDGTQFLFTAPIEGIYTFESKGSNDPCLEYVQKGVIVNSCDDVNSDDLNFKSAVYLEKGEGIRCVVSEKDRGDVELYVTYGGTCNHKDTQWIVYKAATADAKGIKTRVCKKCAFIAEYKDIAQLRPETPVTSAVNTIDGMHISWNRIEGAVKYVVYRKAVGTDNLVAVATTTSTEYLDNGVANNTSYHYTVRAFNSVGGYSVYDSGRIAKIKCVSAPVLAKISNATTGVRIDWSKVAGATGYRVYRRADGVDYWTYLGITKDVKYIDTSVKTQNGKGYTYTVRAVNGVDSGFDGDGLYTIRLSDPVMKSAVSAKDGITVSWGTVKGSTGYYVYRKTAGSGWVKLATVKGVNSVTYLDKTAQKGVTYTYTAKAINGKILSAYSSTINCKDKY